MSFSVHQTSTYRATFLQDTMLLLASSCLHWGGICGHFQSPDVISWLAGAPLISVTSKLKCVPGVYSPYSKTNWHPLQQSVLEVETFNQVNQRLFCEYEKNYNLN